MYTYEDLEDELRANGVAQPRDVADSSSHFGKWADRKGYTNDTKDPEGKHRGSSQIWYAEYRADPQGEAACPPYLDLWHWFLERFDYDRRSHKDDWTLWTEKPGQRFMDVTVTKANLNLQWVAEIMRPVIDAHGGSLDIRLTVDC